MKRLIRALLIVLILYIFCGTVCKDFNPIHWDDSETYGVIISSVIIFIIVEMMIAFKGIAKTIEENDKKEPIN